MADPRVSFRSPGTIAGLSCSPSFTIHTSDHKDTVRVEVGFFQGSTPAPGADFAAVHHSIAFYLHTPEAMRALAADLSAAAEALGFMADKVEALDA